MLAVGAVNERSGATGVNGNQADTSAGNSGAVYVFARTGGLWAQEAYLKASNTEAGDSFGGSVALSGDTLAVGAPREGSSATGVNGNQFDNGALTSGAVYVFKKTAGSWSQDAYLKASNTNAGDEFGWSVALEGDVLAVGAPFEDSLGYGVNPGAGVEANNGAGISGAAYLFTRSGGVWKQEAFVKAPNTTMNSQFGQSVAVAGDALAVGADGDSNGATGVLNGSGGISDDNSAPGSGAVHVYR